MIDQITTTEKPIFACLKCEFGAASTQRECNGPCSCLADSQRRDIIDIARDADCPLGYHGNTPPPPRPPEPPGIAPRTPRTAKPTIRTPAPKQPRKPWYTGMWEELHRRAITWPGGDDSAWMAAFTARVANGGCPCRKHWKELLERMPPDYSSADVYFAWTVAVHNLVNVITGAPQMMLENARTIYQSSLN